MSLAYFGVMTSNEIDVDPYFNLLEYQSEILFLTIMHLLIWMSTSMYKNKSFKMIPTAFLYSILIFHHPFDTVSKIAEMVMLGDSMSAAFLPIKPNVYYAMSTAPAKLS